MKSLTIHGLLLTLALMSLGVIALAAAWGGRLGQENRKPVTIALEHRLPVTLTVGFSMQREVRLVDIMHDSAETLFLSVPRDWHRTEVRGAALASVSAEPAALGFVRWHLPARAGISFRTGGTWRQLSVENPGGVPLTLKVTVVDLESNTASHDVLLVKDETVVVP